MVTRVLDLAVLLLLAVAILMPRPGVQAKPGISADPEGRARIAELQTRLLAAPGDADAALELADIFLDARHPDWALATLTEALAGNAGDHRLHWRRSLALADHFDAAGAHRSAERARALCEGGSTALCGEGEKSRLDLLVATLSRVKDIDMRRDPNRAKEEILKALRPTYIPPKRAPRGDAGAR